RHRCCAPNRLRRCRGGPGRLAQNVHIASDPHFYATELLQEASVGLDKTFAKELLHLLKVVELAVMTAQRLDLDLQCIGDIDLERGLFAVEEVELPHLEGLQTLVQQLRKAGPVA